MAELAQNYHQNLQNDTGPSPSNEEREQQIRVSLEAIPAMQILENPRETRMNGLLQSLKKLSQCLAIFQRLSCRKSNKLHNNLKITYIILCHRDFRISFISCDLVQN